MASARAKSREARACARSSMSIWTRPASRTALPLLAASPARITPRTSPPSSRKMLSACSSASRVAMPLSIQRFASVPRSKRTDSAKGALKSSFMALAKRIRIWSRVSIRLLVISGVASGPRSGGFLSASRTRRAAVFSRSEPLLAASSADSLKSAGLRYRPLRMNIRSASGRCRSSASLIVTKLPSDLLILTPSISRVPPSIQ